jgi:O-antigen/teichoic acid export membrane protein
MDHKLPRRKIIKHISLFTGSSLIQSLGQLFHGYFGARWLGPDTFGAWQGARLIQSYLSYASLGVGHGMHRDVPVLRGQKRLDEIEKIKNCTWTFNLIIYSFASLTLFFISFLLEGNREFLISVRFVAVITEITLFIGFFNVWNKANNRFEVISIVSLINGIISILSIYLIYAGKLSGFLIAKVLTLSFMLIYYLYKNDTKLKYYLNKWIIINEMKIGFPILLLDASTTIFSTIDRILILNKLSFSDLGLYSLSGIIFIPVSVVFTSANSVLYPRVTEKYGKTNDPQSLINMFKVPVLILSHTVPFLVALLYLIVPLLVNQFLIKYQMGIQAAQIVIWGIFFYSLVGTVSNVVIALNKQIYIVIILGLMTILNYVIGRLLIDYGFGINGVALSSFSIYVLYFFILYAIAYVLSKNSLQKFVSDILIIVLPSLLNITVILGINYNFDLSAVNFKNILLIFISILALFILNLKFFKKALKLLGISSYQDFKQLFLSIT